LLNKIQVFRPWEDELNAYQEQLQQRLKQQQQQRFRHIGETRKRKWLQPMNLEITIDGITDCIPFSSVLLLLLPNPPGQSLTQKAVSH
jgi:hypothetical protein